MKQLEGWFQRADESDIVVLRLDFSGVTLLRFIIRRYKMSLGTILLIIVILLLIGAIPSWPHSRGWGYGPSGGLGLVLLILIILLLMGKI